MTNDPYAHDPEAHGLRFQSPFDVLKYHPSPPAEPEPKIRGRNGKPFMTPEQKKAAHARICKAYQATQAGKAVRDAARIKRNTITITHRTEAHSDKLGKLTGRGTPNGTNP